MVHDSKKYLFYALRSLERQILPKDKFEVVVIKNFKNKESDEIIRMNGWKNIVADVAQVGRKWS